MNRSLIIFCVLLFLIPVTVLAADPVAIDTSLLTVIKSKWAILRSDPTLNIPADRIKSIDLEISTLQKNVTTYRSQLRRYRHEFRVQSDPELINRIGLELGSTEVQVSKGLERLNGALDQISVEYTPGAKSAVSESERMARDAQAAQERAMTADNEAQARALREEARTLSQIQDDFQRLQSEFDQLAREKADVLSRNAQLEGEMQGLRNDLGAANDEAARLRVDAERVARLELEKAALERNVLELDGKTTELESKVRQAQSANDELVRVASEKDAATAVKDQIIATQDERIRSVRSQLDNFREAYIEAEGSRQAAVRDLDGAIERINEMGQEITARDRQLNVSNETVAKQEQLIRETTARVEQLKESLRTTTVNRDQLARTLQQATDTLDQLSGTIRAKDVDIAANKQIIRTQQEMAESVNRELESLRGEVKAAQATRDAAVQKSTEIQLELNKVRIANGELLSANGKVVAENESLVREREWYKEALKETNAKLSEAGKAGPIESVEVTPADPSKPPVKVNPTNGTAVEPPPAAAKVPAATGPGSGSGGTAAPAPEKVTTAPPKKGSFTTSMVKGIIFIYVITAVTDLIGHAIDDALLPERSYYAPPKLIWDDLFDNGTHTYQNYGKSSTDMDCRLDASYSFLASSSPSGICSYGEFLHFRETDFLNGMTQSTSTFAEGFENKSTNPLLAGKEAGDRKVSTLFLRTNASRNIFAVRDTYRSWVIERGFARNVFDSFLTLLAPRTIMNQYDMAAYGSPEGNDDTRLIKEAYLVVFPEKDGAFLPQSVNLPVSSATSNDHFDSVLPCPKVSDPRGSSPDYFYCDFDALAQAQNKLPNGRYLAVLFVRMDGGIFTSHPSIIPKMEQVMSASKCNFGRVEDGATATDYCPLLKSIISDSDFKAESDSARKKVLEDKEISDAFADTWIGYGGAWEEAWNHFNDSRGWGDWFYSLGEGFVNLISLPFVALDSITVNQIIYQDARFAIHRMFDIIEDPSNREAAVAMNYGLPVFEVFEVTGSGSGSIDTPTPPASVSTSSCDTIPQTTGVIMENFVGQLDPDSVKRVSCEGAAPAPGQSQLIVETVGAENASIFVSWGKGTEDAGAMVDVLATNDVYVVDLPGVTSFNELQQLLIKSNPEKCDGAPFVTAITFTDPVGNRTNISSEFIFRDSDGELKRFQPPISAVPLNCTSSPSELDLSRVTPVGKLFNLCGKVYDNGKKTWSVAEDYLTQKGSILIQNYRDMQGQIVYLSQSTRTAVSLSWPKIKTLFTTPAGQTQSATLKLEDVFQMPAGGLASQSQPVLDDSLTLTQNADGSMSFFSPDGYFGASELTQSDNVSTSGLSLETQPSGNWMLYESDPITANWSTDSCTPVQSPSAASPSWQYYE